MADVARPIEVARAGKVVRVVFGSRVERITGDLFDLAADPLQTKTLLWPDGKAVEPRVDQRFDHVKQRLGQLLTQ